MSNATPSQLKLVAIQALSDCIEENPVETVADQVGFPSGQNRADVVSHRDRIRKRQLRVTENSMNGYSHNYVSVLQQNHPFALSLATPGANRSETTGYGYDPIGQLISAQAFEAGGAPRLTAADLQNARSSNGNTGLHAAAVKGHLDQIKGGVTLEQLSGPPGLKGYTPLFWAVREGHMDQISGGVTVAQLDAIRIDSERTLKGLAYHFGSLLQAKGGNYPDVPIPAGDEDGGVDLMCQNACEAFEKGSNEDKRIGLYLLTRLRAELPNNGRAHFHLAITYSQIKLQDQALASARRAATLLPNDSEVWHFLAQKLYQRKRMKESYEAAQ